MGGECENIVRSVGHDASCLKFTDMEPFSQCCMTAKIEIGVHTEGKSGQNKANSLACIYIRLGNNP